jgi:TonB family protein
MEAFGLYLLKSVIWLSGFALIFILFLRNERFFVINRLYLIAGILISFLFPLLTVHYAIDMPVTGGVQTAGPVVSGFQEVSHGSSADPALLLMVLYITGALFVALMIVRQGNSVIKSIKKAEIITSHPVKLIRTSDYASSFSFFSYVFVNPSVTDHETEEILNHEMVHIRQMHWVDLVLVEMLRVLQWFNPFIWIYIRFIRQNHEYLADEVALQRTSDPAKYRAALLNQIVGSPVVSLSNYFNYSLNKKRFNMMKNIISSPYRKMKVFLILPVFAIILYAFATPEYRLPAGYNSDSNNDKTSILQEKVVKGIVLQKSGAPLIGATIVAKGTTIGTSTDSKGYFTLSKIPADGSLIITYVGFSHLVVKPDYDALMRITMERDTLNIGSAGTVPPPPPPPPFPPYQPGDPEMGKALVVLDGKVGAVEIGDIDPNSIASVNVLKDKSATDKYGEKGKDGVLEITTKKKASKGNKDVQEVVVKGYASEQKVVKGQKTEGAAIPSEPKVVKGQYIMVEEMPSYPGGEQALIAWISSNIKYPGEAVKKNITGQVIVAFEVTEIGSVYGVKVVKSVHPLLDAEAIRVVSGMPKWKAGSQNGKPVDVLMKIPIEFSLDKVIKDTNK